MLVFVIFLICNVTSTIICSHIDQINNVSCAVKKPLAASRFHEHGVECLSPADIFAHERFSKVKFMDINVAVRDEYYYPHFEKYICKDFQWKKRQFLLSSVGAACRDSTSIWSSTNDRTYQSFIHF